LNEHSYNLDVIHVRAFNPTTQHDTADAVKVLGQLSSLSSCRFLVHPSLCPS